MRLADQECQSKSDQGVGAADFETSERVRVDREAVMPWNGGASSEKAGLPYGLLDLPTGLAVRVGKGRDGGSERRLELSAGGCHLGFDLGARPESNHAPHKPPRLVESGSRLT